MNHICYIPNFIVTAFGPLWSTFSKRRPIRIPNSVREINDSGKSISADFIPFPGKISLTYLSVVEMVSVVVTPIKERKNLRQN